MSCVTCDQSWFVCRSWKATTINFLVPHAGAQSYESEVYLETLHSAIVKGVCMIFKDFQIDTPSAYFQAITWLYQKLLA